MNAVQLLPAVREVFSRYPETRALEAYHLAWILFALGYVEDLEDEASIAAASDVARMDWPLWRPAA